MTTLPIPTPSLVVLAGASGSGKSTFAARHFAPTEIVSSDRCRGLVCDDESDQASSTAAFTVLRAIVEARLSLYKTAVVDATNVHTDHRRELVALARKHHLLPVLVAFDLPIDVCKQRNAARPERVIPEKAVVRQAQALRRSLRHVAQEKFHTEYVLKSPEEMDAVTGFHRQRLALDCRDDSGPFDVIGDVHGCADELAQLLHELGYVGSDRGADGHPVYAHPAGRKAVFVGDLCDRGPANLAVIHIVLRMLEWGSARWTLGNHDRKFSGYLSGRKVQRSNGLDLTIAEFEALPEADREAFRTRYVEAARAAPSHVWLDHGHLVVAHAGIREDFIGRVSGEVRNFTLYGDTTGEKDADGFPVRLDWAQDYRGRAFIVYGHSDVDAPRRIGKTLNIDTGCVFGGKLTAFRWPENEIVQVPAAREYFAPHKPLATAAAERAASDADDLLDAELLVGERAIETRLDPHVRIYKDHAAAAFEQLVRFCVDPRWLVYLPPTMAPCEAHQGEGAWLERPEEACAYYRSKGVTEVICEEKHMGSRAVVVLCRDDKVGAARFGIAGPGCIYTRTGRRFFSDAAMEASVFSALRSACDRADFWTEIESDWAAFDCEVMPWNAKGEGLVKDSFAVPAVAASASLPVADAALAAAVARGVDVGGELARVRRLTTAIDAYKAAYRAYCWTVVDVASLRIAPFQVLAAEGRTFFDRRHDWHTTVAARLAGVFSSASPEPGTPWWPTIGRCVDLTGADAGASAADAITWWEAACALGAEGVVVKPASPVVMQADATDGGRERLVQPALKVRGREYLRIIYGPDYDEAENLRRLRIRKTGGKKALAAREFAIGVEGLERFVRKEPIARVHECVFGVLALESEPVDPRL